MRMESDSIGEMGQTNLNYNIITIKYDIKCTNVLLVEIVVF